ncbi:MAG: phosphonate metabolism transcriptional regulator PhnF [Pseudomonadota bacterium]
MTGPEAERMVAPSKKTALWLEIRETLSREIDEARYPAGGRLPTEQSLAARFGVNRHTVRRALAGLAEAGLIHLRRGAPATVIAAGAASAPLDYTLSKRTRFGENIRMAGRSPHYVVLRFERQQAGLSEAETLKIDQGAPVLMYETTSRADDIPLSYARHVFPLDRLPGIEQQLEMSNGITAAFGALGHRDYRRAWTRITAAMPTADIARHLAMSPDEPTLTTASMDVAIDGTPLSTGRTWFCAARVTLLVEDDGVAPKPTHVASSDEADGVKR